jgi:Fe-S cluster biogenesis protein NfuA
MAAGSRSTKPGREPRAEQAAVGVGVAATAAVAVEAAVIAAVEATVVATIDSASMMNTSATQRDTSASRVELQERIERVLEEQVRPDLRADGGDIIVVGIDGDNIVQVRLTGACQGCSSSVYTLSMRVEATLKAEIPEIRFLEAVP